MTFDPDDFLVVDIPNPYPMGIPRRVLGPLEEACKRAARPDPHIFFTVFVGGMSGRDREGAGERIRALLKRCNVPGDVVGPIVEFCSARMTGKTSRVEVGYSASMGQWGARFFEDAPP